MAANTRSATQREADLAEVARRYLAGETQQMIAIALGISRSQVSYDLATLRRRWRESSMRDFEVARAAELAKVDNLERQYWESWHRSEQEQQRTRTRRVRAGAKGKRDEVSLEREARDGDPRFLAGVQWCIERRCKLLGLDAPARTAADVTAREQENTRASAVRYDLMTDEELDTILKIMSRVENEAARLNADQPVA